MSDIYEEAQQELNSPPPVCYLDMDGVLADFIGAALRLHGAEGLYQEERARGVFNTEALLGLTPDEFWAPINRVGNFWSSLEKTAEADDIVAWAEVVFGKKHVVILTAPALGNACFLGKRLWLQQHYPQFISRLAFAKGKSLFASPRHTLVDDKDSNVDKFTEAGGRGILLPRIWNSQWRHSATPLEVLSCD